MNFERTPPDAIDRARFPTTLAQWASAGGGWWIHLNAMLYGVRCYAGRAGDAGGYEVSYCCGANRHAILLVPAVVMKILESVPEAAAGPDVAALFPPQTIRPMHIDPVCWAELCRRAGVDVIDLSPGDL